MTVDKWKEKFGENLEARMKERGLRQSHLAKKINVAPSRIRDYIDGCCVPNGWRLVNLATALECSVDDLVDFGDMVVEFR